MVGWAIRTSEYYAWKKERRKKKKVQTAGFAPCLCQPLLNPKPKADITEKNPAIAYSHVRGPLNGLTFY